jgi:hypothetical protein
MTNSTFRIAFVAIAATLIAMPTQIQAQDTFAALDIEPRPAAAEEMEALAYDLVLGGRGWEDAAGMYRRAAELRGSSDARAAMDLRLAGYIYFYRGRAPAAIASLTQSGEAFLALGDVSGAAEAFIDGAWVAAKWDMPTEAAALGERALLLTRSPILPAEERFALARRLGVTTPGTE